jgi:hypothetical protein
LAFSRFLESRGHIQRLRSCVLHARLTQPAAAEHFHRGLPRRLGMIVESCDYLSSIVPPERTEPLADGGAALNLHLNSIYMHVRGSLDNVAWALAHETGCLGPVDESVVRQRRRVTISPSFLDSLAQHKPELSRGMKNYTDALNFLPNLRDPSAHRMPLYVVPCVLTIEQTEEMKQAEQAVNHAVASGDWDAVDTHLAARDQIGTFVPIFAHTTLSANPTFPLYPTLAGHLAALVGIVGCTIKALAPARSS